jgi:CPA1 family monovalent cation:H+ antiporter
MTCTHLDATSLGARPVPDDRFCADCRALDHDDWVHLRMCLDCGRMGCCDSSPGRHASAHYAEAKHPVMRSIEPNEAWRWCFADEALG